jgi:hypothetical protein
MMTYKFCHHCGADTVHDIEGECQGCAERAAVVGGASDDTKRAMRENPDYWLSWYTFKSLALVAAIGTIGYMAGDRRCDSRVARGRKQGKVEGIDQSTREMRKLLGR